MPHPDQTASAGLNAQELQGRLSSLTPEEQMLLSSVMTPDVVAVLHKLLGPEFSEILDMGLNSGPLQSRPNQLGSQPQAALPQTVDRLANIRTM